MTLWRERKATQREPSLKSELRAGKKSCRRALSIARGDARVQMNVEVLPWVRNTFKELARNEEMSLSEYMTLLVVLLYME